MSAQWRPVTDDEPREYRTVLFHRAGDLYPVVGWRMYGQGEWHWYLWEGGEEDRETQQYPGIGGEGWEATHWMPLEDLPRLAVQVAAEESAHAP